MKYAKSIGFTVGFLIGLPLPIIAAYTGSVGPEPPRTFVGDLLAWVYMPVLLYPVMCFGWWMGLTVLAILQGLVFGLCGWIGGWLSQRLRLQSDAPALRGRIRILIARGRHLIGGLVAVLCAAFTLCLTAFIGWYDPQPPLIEAIMEDDAQTALKLIGEGADPNAADDRSGYTALHWTAFRGQRAAAEALIAAGADMNAADFSGYTPLMSALIADKLEIARMLIEAGADVKAANFIGQTALHWAAGCEDVELVRLLLARGADVHAATKQSQGVGEAGETPLHYAAAMGRIEAAKLLLAAGADVNAGRGQAGTPLHEAAQAGQKEMTVFLLERGADVSARDMSGRTPRQRLDSVPMHDENLAELLKQHEAE